MVKFYFIRHAESTWNAFGDTNYNVPITDKGKEQAKGVRGFVHICVCSTLRRTRETLDNSLLKYDEVIYSDLCREIRLGNRADYIEGEDVGVHETNEGIWGRVEEFKKFIRELGEKNPGKVIGVVSHSNFISHVCGHLMYNCQVLQVEI